MKNLYAFLLVICTYSTMLGQAKVAGLGALLIGKTKVQDLNPIDFTEHDQSNGYGKQYIVCDKVRIFDAPTFEVAGLYLSNVRLTFYENLLSEISCDFDDELKKAFVLKYGKGKLLPKRVVVYCNKKGKTTSIYNEDWLNSSIRARSGTSKGYNFDCEYEQTSTLFITNLQTLKATSDCTGANSASTTNRAIKGADQYIDSLKNIERERIRKIKKEL